MLTRMVLCRCYSMTREGQDTFLKKKKRNMKTHSYFHHAHWNISIISLPLYQCFFVCFASNFNFSPSENSDPLDDNIFSGSNKKI